MIVASQVIPVFLIEDSRNMQSALAELFDVVGGFEIVATATTETAATAWLQRSQSDWGLAVVDLMLDEGTGFNLLQRLKTARPAARVVVLSDFVTPAVETRCRAMGADAVFRKVDAQRFSAYLEQLSSGAADPE
jgi:DNA-binding NarL/FixJ family response regulator